MINIVESDLDYKRSNFYNYKNIPIYAERGVHEGVFDQFMKYSFSKDIKILVLGCGAGAFDQRLIDVGYNNIISVDLELAFYHADNQNLLKRNLNDDFSDLGKFDIVFAIEIIEHLENQFHFFRNATKILGTSGYMFLTTPNVEAQFSKISFLAKGTLNSFTQRSLETLGHVSPIFNYMVNYNLEINSLFLVQKIGLSPKKMTFLQKIYYKFISGDNSFINFYVISHKA